MLLTWSSAGPVTILSQKSLAVKKPRRRWRNGKENEMWDRKGAMGGKADSGERHHRRLEKFKSVMERGLLTYHG